MSRNISLQHFFWRGGCVTFGGIIKTMNNATLRCNWPLNVKNFAQNNDFLLFWERNMAWKLLQRLFVALLEWVGFKWPLDTGGDNTKRPLRLKGDRDRWIEVKIPVIKGTPIWDFGNRPLNSFGRLKTVPLHRGSTVFYSFSQTPRKWPKS